MPYRYLAGVEPCPGGWLVAAGRLQGITLLPEDPVVVATFAEVIDQRPAFDVVALHAPVGLLEEPRPGGRACDHAARRLLGWPRMAGVVPAPVRPALVATTLAEAAAVNGGMSPVTWALINHAAAVDAEMVPYRQRIVHEVQPELCFFELNDRVPMAYAKATDDGRSEREELLTAKVQGIERVTRARVGGAGRVHLIDAAADLWTARRVAAKVATRLPDEPEWDATGLRMELVY